MSQTFRYVSPGQWTVDLGTQAVRLGTLQGFVTMAELGGVGMSTVIIDNPSGTVGHSSDQIVGWKQFTDDEGLEASGNQRVYTGYITQRTYRRRANSSLITGPANEIEVSLSDLNETLSFHILTGTDANRPSETVSARMTWLLASTYLSGLVYDNGFVHANTTVMDANDYTGQTPATVIGDCALAAHYNFFVYYHESNSQPSLWFDDSNTSNAWDSGISISNTLADIDQAAIANGTATTFYPFVDAELHRDPTRCYSGVYMPYAKGHVYVTDATIQSNFTGRDGSIPNSNVQTAAAATVVANHHLADNATEDDRITVTIQPVAAQVNAVLAGQLVQGKWSHLPGYASYTKCRVLQRSVAQSIEDDTRYQVQLILSPATPIATIVQSVSGQSANAVGSTVAFPNPVTAGNLLIAAVGHRNGGSVGLTTAFAQITDPSGLTSYAFTPFGSPTFVAIRTGDIAGADEAGIGWRIATGTEQNIRMDYTHTQFTFYEIAGGTQVAAELISLSNQGSSAGKSIGGFSNPGNVQISIFLWDTGDPGASPTQTVGAGWTQDQQTMDNGPTGHPGTVTMHATTRPTAQISGTSYGWGGIAVNIPNA